MKTKFAFLFCLVSLFAFSQTQIGEDIDGEEAYDYAGVVSLSANGNIIAVSSATNNDVGYVRMYENISGSWSQLGQSIVGTAIDYIYPKSVSLSTDGSIVAIGFPQFSLPSLSGLARIYQNIGGTWTQIGEDMDGENEGDQLGRSISLSADGNVVAIGAPGNDGINGINSGHVRVYQNTNGAWIKIGEDIDGESAYDTSGSAVSLNDDGSIVAIGANLNDGNGNYSGHVRVFRNINGNWAQIGQDIDGEAVEDESGYSVDLSSDGNILAIGARYNDGNGPDSGHVRVYQNTGGEWSQIGEDIDGEAAFDNMGNFSSVSIAADGNTLALGAVWANGTGGLQNTGHVRIFKNIAGSWTQFGNEINGEAANDGSGYSVSLSADGSTAAIGALWNDGNGVDAGHVRVYDLTTLSVDDNLLLDFSVYPSPTAGILNIKSESTIGQIEIYNQLGQLVASNKHQNTIDISSVSQGIYFIKVTDDSGYFGTQKVVRK